MPILNFQQLQKPDKTIGNARNAKKHLTIIESQEITRVILMPISHVILN